MKIKIKIKVTNQDISDILVTAFEGGINYWCGKVETIKGSTNIDDIVEQITSGGAVILHDSESEEYWTFGIKSFKRGLRAFLKKNNLNEIDTGMIDADDADEIIQVGLFGKMVYG